MTRVELPPDFESWSTDDRVQWVNDNFAALLADKEGWKPSTAKVAAIYWHERDDLYGGTEDEEQVEITVSIPRSQLDLIHRGRAEDPDRLSMYVRSALAGYLRQLHDKPEEAT